MDLTLREFVTIFANFCLMAALIVYAFRWFATYFTSGKWTKNITGLLAGIGFLLLAAAVLLTPQNAAVMVLIARTHAHVVFIVASNADGYGVDRCLTTGASCGTMVATAYCQARDFSQARSFRKVDQDEITGGGAKNQACGIGCDELVAIECTR